MVAAAWPTCACPEATSTTCPATRTATAPARGRCATVIDQGGQLELFCGVAGSGTGQLGDTCAGPFFENGDDCATGLCDGDVAGICTIACDADDDCGGSARICTGSGYTNIPGTFCAPSCAREADCPEATRSCQLRRDYVANAIEPACNEHRGTEPANTVVSTAGECQTNFAINDDGVRYCTELCVDASDCPAGLTRCTTVNMNRPSGAGTQPISACARP